MANKWVGWIACLVLLAASAGAGGQSGEYREQFWDENTDWLPVTGNVSVTSTHGSDGQLLEYLQLDGNGEGGLEFARTHVDPAAVNTTFSGYEVVALIERDPDYAEAPGGPGWFGITFGEQDGSFRIAGLTNEQFFIADATDTGMTKVYEQNLTAADWDQVPNVPDHRKDDGVDQRLRYALQVLGTTVSLKINGWTLASTTLPDAAPGTFGLAAQTGTSIHTQEVVYRMLDVAPPLVDIYRPANQTFYIDDMSFQDAMTGGTAIVIGELTLGADVLDQGTGVESARLYVDGEYVPGSRNTETGYETNWTIDTSALSLGYHEITVRASDLSGNIAEESVRILVISDRITSGTGDDLAEALENLLP